MPIEPCSEPSKSSSTLSMTYLGDIINLDAVVHMIIGRAFLWWGQLFCEFVSVEGRVRIVCLVKIEATLMQ